MFLSILTAIIIAIIFSSILGFGFRRKGPGPIGWFLYLFLIIFSFAWAIGVWIEPVHPTHIEYPWLSFLFIGFFIMLLLGVILPPVQSRNRAITKSDLNEKLKTDEVIGLTFGLFYWIMVIVLIIMGIAKWIS